MAFKGKEKPVNVPLADVIRAEAEEAKRDQGGIDDEFDPNRDLNFAHGPSAFRRTMADKDQLVIDELLSSLPKNQGYYLKLYREIMPGKWELKEQINQYDTWTDLELEIAERVKAMTRKFGSKKWGSGLYRIVIWKSGGIREANKYPPIDVIVDAGDSEDASANIHAGKVDPLEAANEQLQALGNMLSAVKGIMPAAADPNIQFQAIANAFAQGKGDKKDNDQLMMQLMMTMMTTMMTSMKDLALVGRQPVGEQRNIEDNLAKMLEVLKGFGVVGNSSNGPKTLTEQIADLKLLGIDPFKKEDAIDMLAKLKTIMGTVTDLVPSGSAKVERPGILEKLIDALAPHVPKMVSDLRTITDNAALAKTMEIRSRAEMMAQQRAMAAVKPEEVRPMTRYGQPIGPQPRMSASDAFDERPQDMDPFSQNFNERPSERSADGREENMIFDSGSFATARKAKQPQPVAPEPQATASIRESGEQPASVPQPVVEQPFEMPPLLQQLSVLVQENIVDAYPALFDTLAKYPESRIMLDGIKAGLVTQEMMVMDLQGSGGPLYNHPTFVEKLDKYVAGFIVWIKENENGTVIAACEKCTAQHTFESLGHFNSTNKLCNIETGVGQTCNGMLVLRGTHNEKQPT